jgi:hypothetical protein
MLSFPNVRPAAGLDNIWSLLGACLVVAVLVAELLLGWSTTVLEPTWNMLNWWLIQEQSFCWAGQSLETTWKVLGGSWPSNRAADGLVNYLSIPGIHLAEL